MLICILSLNSGCGKKDIGPRDGSLRPFTPASITLKEQGELKELVDGSLTFLDSSGVEWTAPQGTLTDGASVPRLALPVTDGRWDTEFLKAAVVHDAYCQEDNETRCPDQYRTKPWRAVHRMFYDACVAGGTSSLKAKIMFAAVWLAGPRWDDPDERLQQASPDLLTIGFTGSKEWIEQNDPTVEEIEADMGRREPLLLDLHELETGVLTALEDGNATKADELLRHEETLLTKELNKSPDDLMLLNFKGYYHKNRAMLYRHSNIDDKADAELSNSEQAFSAVIKRESKDPSALNGLGSVSILRGDLDRADQYVRKAIAVAPNYQAAKHDLQLIGKLRKSPPPKKVDTTHWNRGMHLRPLDESPAKASGTTHGEVEMREALLQPVPPHGIRPPRR